MLERKSSLSFTILWMSDRNIVPVFPHCLNCLTLYKLQFDCVQGFPSYLFFITPLLWLSIVLISLSFKPKCVSESYQYFVSKRFFCIKHHNLDFKKSVISFKSRVLFLRYILVHLDSMQKMTSNNQDGI